MDNNLMKNLQIVHLQPNDVILIRVDTSIYTLDMCKELVETWRLALPNHSIIIETYPYVQTEIIRGELE